ncbi:hypothetical protein BDV59DRAFT_14091 [Aspergillus ambiguus]|uniref:uncharacterized protein n=1 Tax=Aspergillus ambiguus TaxID=176160 RepID=UPI003CCE3E01
MALRYAWSIPTVYCIDLYSILPIRRLSTAPPVGSLGSHPHRYQHLHQHNIQPQIDPAPVFTNLKAKLDPDRHWIVIARVDFM